MGMCILPGNAIPEMTYIASGRRKTLLTHSGTKYCPVWVNWLLVAGSPVVVDTMSTIVD